MDGPPQRPSGAFRAGWIDAPHGLRRHSHAALEDGAGQALTSPIQGLESAMTEGEPTAGVDLISALDL